MSTPYRISGDLFDAKNVEQLQTYPEWNSEEIERARRAIEELLEKREALLEEGPDRANTSYYWTSYVLRRLGYCHSVAERTPSEDDTRPDFTLFYDAQDFYNARPHRSTRDFFGNALGVIRSLGWTESLDEISAEDDSQPANPAYELDRYLRSTGVPWGILTNGRVWRLLHRDTSGLMNTYYEIDLLSTLESNNLNDFKYFWMIFGPAALGGSSMGEPIVNRLYD